MQYAIIIRSIIKISFRVLWVSKIEVDKYERLLKKRFNAVKTQTLENIIAIFQLMVIK